MPARDSLRTCGAHGAARCRAGLDLAAILQFVLAVNDNHIAGLRSEEHTSELQSRLHLVCRLLLEKKKKSLKRPNIATTSIKTINLCAICRRLTTPICIP